MEEIVALAIQQIPNLIEVFKELHQQKNPAAPPLTDDQVISAYQEALTSSWLKDDQWLAVHGDPPAA